MNKISETEAVNLIEENLSKGPRRGPKPEEEAVEAEADDGEEAAA